MPDGAVKAVRLAKAFSMQDPPRLSADDCVGSYSFTAIPSDFILR